MKRHCPKCNAEWEIKGPIGFREECPECAAFLHTCANCAQYEPGTRGCRILTTESVRDRQSVNFCEDFEFNPEAPGSDKAARRAPAGAAKPSASAKPSADEARRKFDALFREPKK